MRVLLEITPAYFQSFTQAVREPDKVSSALVFLSFAEREDIRSFSSASPTDLLFSLFESFDISSALRPSDN